MAGDGEVTKHSKIEDIATFAGLSVRSVTDHLKGRRPLPSRTSARIEAAIREIGPLDMVPELEPRRNAVFIVPNVTNPFFASLVQSFQVAARDRGCDLLVYPTLDHPATEERLLRRALQDRSNAVLLSTNNGHRPELAALCDGALNLVAVNEQVIGSDTHFVGGDNRRAGELAAEAIMSVAQEDFCVISGPLDVDSAVQRAAGFRATIQRAIGAGADIVEYFGSYSCEHGYESIRRMARKRGRMPRGILAASDTIAAGVVTALRELSCRVPEDLILASIDGTYLIPLLGCPIIQLRLPHLDLASAALEIALRAPRYAKPINRRLPPQLIETAACGALQ